jgi:hypothetical protein
MADLLLRFQTSKRWLIVMDVDTPVGWLIERALLAAFTLCSLSLLLQPFIR